MFEAVILMALLGVILLYIITAERKPGAHRASFIDLTAELKPSTRKPLHQVRAKKLP